jgi:hypothetical protein
MYRKMLVPIDGGATSEAGLIEAIAVAAWLKARLCVLPVVTSLPLVVELSSTMNAEEVCASLNRYGRTLLDLCSWLASRAPRLRRRAAVAPIARCLRSPWHRRDCLPRCDRKYGRMRRWLDRHQCVLPPAT